MKGRIALLVTALSLAAGVVAGALIVGLFNARWGSAQVSSQQVHAWPEWLAKPPEPPLRVGEMLPENIPVFDATNNQRTSFGAFLRQHPGIKILTFISTCQGCAQKYLLALDAWSRLHRHKAVILVITTDAPKATKIVSSNLKRLNSSLILLSDFTKQLMEQKRLSQFAPFIIVLNASNRVSWIQPVSVQWEQTLDLLSQVMRDIGGSG